MEVAGLKNIVMVRKNNFHLLDKKKAKLEVHSLLKKKECQKEKNHAGIDTYKKCRMQCINDICKHICSVTVLRDLTQGFEFLILIRRH